MTVNYWLPVINKYKFTFFLLSSQVDVKYVMRCTSPYVCLPIPTQQYIKFI